MTLTRTALVTTDVPARWAKQLASHLERFGAKSGLTVSWRD